MMNDVGMMNDGKKQVRNHYDSSFIIPNTPVGCIPCTIDKIRVSDWLA